jgi:hypothetical protein
MSGRTLTKVERDVALAGMVRRSVRLGASAGEAVRAVARDNRLSPADVIASVFRARCGLDAPDSVIEEAA